MISTTFFLGHNTCRSRTFYVIHFYILIAVVQVYVICLCGSIKLNSWNLSAPAKLCKNKFPKSNGGRGLMCACTKQVVLGRTFSLYV